jgi:hypothetical protein
VTPTDTKTVTTFVQPTGVDRDELQLDAAVRYITLFIAAFKRFALTDGDGGAASSALLTTTAPTLMLVYWMTSGTGHTFTPDQDYNLLTVFAHNLSGVITTDGRTWNDITTFAYPSDGAQVFGILTGFGPTWSINRANLRLTKGISYRVSANTAGAVYLNVQPINPIAA